jgi:hypothetical protein
MSNQLDLFVPDRFDTLQRRAVKRLNSIIVPVHEGINRIKDLHGDIRAAGRGGFLLLRGNSGSGKSTFLNTLGLFLEGVEVFSISRTDALGDSLRTLGVTGKEIRVVIIEGRDALRDVPPEELEAAIHDINAFIRTANGERTLVVWPVNADDLETALISVCQRVGADSLLGSGSPSFKFEGPPKEQYVDIASRTIATLNQGSSLAALGVSDERAVELVKKSHTIGHFLGLIRNDLTKNKTAVQTLLSKELCKVWIIVAASNDPEGDIAGITRDTVSAADIGRLINATNANIVTDLKRFPEKLGILGTVLDAKILNLPVVTALAIARDFGGAKLKSAMTASGMSTAGDGDATERLNRSDVGRALRGEPMGPKSVGAKVGSNTIEAFEKLTQIASKNDVWLNDAIGNALKSAGLITSYETEQDLGTGLSRVSDLKCQTAIGVVRMELMWRARTGRAEIANYTLTKLYNYGKAIGFLGES